MTDEHRGSASFAVRLDHLFCTVKNAEGKLYSNRAAATLLAARGCPISHTHVGKLRRGDADPRRSEMIALAELFGVSLTYFIDQPERSAAQPTAAGQEDATRRLARALDDPVILSVAMRMGDARMSAAGKAAVVAMVEHVLLLEQQAREQRDAIWSSEG